METEKILTRAEGGGKMQCDTKGNKLQTELLKKEKSDLDLLASETKSTNNAILTDNAALKEELNLLSATTTVLRKDVDVHHPMFF